MQDDGWQADNGARPAPAGQALDQHQRHASEANRQRAHLGRCLCYAECRLTASRFKMMRILPVLGKPC